MLEFLDVAHPVLSVTMVGVLLVCLWLISVLSTRVRVLESRLESLEMEQRQVDEELAVLSTAGHSAPPPDRQAAPLSELLGERESSEEVGPTPA